MTLTTNARLAAPEIETRTVVDAGPVFVLDSRACETAVHWAGYRGLALYSALAAIAPPDGTRFVSSYSILSELSCLSVRQVRRWLPMLALGGVVKVGKMADDGLHRLGFVPLRMPAIPAAAIRAARRGWKGRR